MRLARQEQQKPYPLCDKNKVAQGFKATYSHECRPHFIGVWDTVASLGHIVPARSFSDNILNHDVVHGYHAVSIDEKRKKFPVSLWDENRQATHQSIEQVWFAGVHSDIGGWYNERGLSDIALKWMMQKAEGAGLRVRNGWDNDLCPNPNDDLHESRKGFWRVWRPAPREIPNGAPIHKSEIDRSLEPDNDYAPPLMQKYEIRH